jgi:3-isopropylmalate dehydrogenase
VTVVLLPGDGIGPEVMDEARKIMAAVELAEAPIGATAIAEAGDPLPPATLQACLAAEAVLMGAVGSPNHHCAEVQHA